MPQCLSILMYGKDAPLLDTRKMVLESTGHRVWPASNPAAFKRIVSDQLIDLVVLCHSLSSEECNHALAVVELEAPHVGSLLLTAGPTGCVGNGSSEVLDTMDGPRQLISTVNRIATLHISSLSTG